MRRGLMLILATLAMTAAAAAYDAWTVNSTDNPGDTMIVDPSTATTTGRGKVSIEFDYFQEGKLIMRRSLVVTGCNKLRGTVTLVDDDVGFGIQNWVANGDHSYDLLAVRACNAASLKQKSET